MNKLLDLAEKPVGYTFNKEEISLIKKHYPKSKMKVKYATYKLDSYKGLYVGFFIDLIPHAPRRSGIENHWNFFCERELTNIEYNEVIENFGMYNRRFIIYQYRYVESLILEDKKYNVETPNDFIKKCKELGHSGDIQLPLLFES